MKYNLKPTVDVRNKGKAIVGYRAIIEEIKSYLGNREDAVIVLECYPGVRKEEIENDFLGEFPEIKEKIFIDEYGLTVEEVQKKFEIISQKIEYLVSIPIIISKIFIHLNNWKQHEND
ncbi:hypothetical protein QUB72_04325 [Enterococcus faecium]|nr:hypothetical protein [Enterococcus faecium]